MTRTIRAHFDGRVLVPDEPVDLPVDQPLELAVTTRPTGAVSDEERNAAIDRLLARPIHGLDIPDWALSREHLYED